MQDKLENNYSVYQHVTPDNMYYFGQTQNIERRWRNNGAGYKGTALYPYIEKYGWDNIQHIVLFRDQTRENALWIEDFLITTAREDGVCINQRRSGLVSKEEGYKREYREENKEQISEQKKQYYEQNKDKIREYYEQNKDKIREYYEQNKDKIREYQREYQEQNKDKISEQKKQYYEQNKQQIREYQRQYYQRKKQEKQFKEFGNLPLW